jgi:competence protein ComFC
MLRLIRRAGSAALDLVYPRGVACALCGTDLDEPGGALCPDCAGRLPGRSGPACPRCGRSVPGEGRCRMCREYGPAADEGYSAYDYDGEAKRLLLAFKFNDRTGLRELLGHAMLEALRAGGATGAIDCVVPVPMHPLRKFNRGYNQSALLAAWVASGIARPLVRGALIRPVYTTASARSNGGPEQRYDSARKSFRPGRGALEGCTVLLVDDILTTGATIRSCTAILKRMGAEKVICVVAAAVPE